MNGIVQVDKDGVTDAETPATALASFADHLAILHTQEVCILFYSIVCLSLHVLSVGLPLLICLLFFFLSICLSACLSVFYISVWFAEVFVSGLSTSSPLFI